MFRHLGQLFSMHWALALQSSEVRLSKPNKGVDHGLDAAVGCHWRGIMVDARPQLATEKKYVISIPSTQRELLL